MSTPTAGNRDKLPHLAAMDYKGAVLWSFPVDAVKFNDDGSMVTPPFPYDCAIYGWKLIPPPPPMTVRLRFGSLAISAPEDYPLPIE